MPLSWNEIRSRAIAFSREWAEESREHAEAKSFWDGFFDVFGLTRRHVASYEAPVKQLGGTYGFIDLLMKGTLIAEHKSRGKDLGRAHSQAMDYIQSLQREGRGDEAPQFVVVSDFARIALHDLEEDTTHEFALGELHKNVQHFAFIPGYKTHKLRAEDPVNLKAVQIMGDLHDAVEADGFTGHELERFLVRVLFCLFAEDTGIFDRDAFTLFIENHTKSDGANLGSQLSMLFQVLNTPQDKRQKSLQEELAALPYVNGDLFGETLPIPFFNTQTRNALLACTRFDWGRISPAVFGALFQGVMDKVERRQVGAHYTSERDILKVIGPLFLDALKADLEKAGTNKAKLNALHERLAKIKLLDPACGCGNFLVISYRELRLLELEVLTRLTKNDKQKVLNVADLLKVDVDQMYGIEIEEWPARIAEVAMWLVDHQMNQRVSERFGQYVVRLPLKKSPHIAHGNALQRDWNDVLPARDCTHVLGNPPFVGAKYQSKEQRAEVSTVFKGVKNAGLLDFVTCWHYLAAQYIQGTSSTVAFVSTNSITQGEQVGVLWPALFTKGVVIHFAHRTFAWQSDAKGAAHVHVVIIGFGLQPAAQPLLFDYETLKGEPTAVPVNRICPYLVEADNVALTNRSRPLSDVPKIGIGNKPIDGGNYLFTDEEKKAFVKLEPASKPYFRRWYGSYEYINRQPRWCLWLGDCPPQVLRSMPESRKRVEAVRKLRKESDSKPTQSIADRPTRFHVENMPTGPYLLVPKVSSERRAYIPMGFMKPDVLCSDLVFLIPHASLYELGILTSAIHMAWVRYVAGRLKSDYRYSGKLVYNNYPWPKDVSDAKRRAVEEAAQGVLDARDAHPDATLADLYDPLAMPADLKRAHDKLDRAVDKCYRAKAFASERDRVEHLFKLYGELTQPLLPAKAKTAKPRRQPKA